MLTAELPDDTLVELQQCTKKLIVQADEATVSVSPHMVD